MQHNYHIQTKNLHLQPLSEKDSQKFRILRNHSENLKWFKTKSIISEQEQSMWYRKYVTSATEIMFSIYDIKSGTFIGALGLYDIDYSKKQAEIGRIIIDRSSFSGHGYGTEALIAIFHIAFEQLNLRRIYAEIYNSNIPSLKSFQNAHCQIISSHYDTDGNLLVTTEITKEHFFSVVSPSQT